MCLVCTFFRHPCSGVTRVHLGSRAADPSTVIDPPDTNAFGSFKKVLLSISGYAITAELLPQHTPSQQIIMTLSIQCRHMTAGNLIHWRYDSIMNSLGGGLLNWIINSDAQGWASHITWLTATVSRLQNRNEAFTSWCLISLYSCSSWSENLPRFIDRLTEIY